jgi:hypothetical protein
MTQRKWPACALLALALGFLTSSARAEPEWIIGNPSEERRPAELSLGAGVGGGRHTILTPGVMFGIPLLDGGFIRPINDSLYLEPGVFMGAHFRDDDTYLWVIPEVGPKWNFHLTPRWDVYASLKLGWAIGRHGDFWLRSNVGMQWWVNRPWALRLETGAGIHHGAGLFIGASYQFL